MINTLVCPHCGAEYLPQEIFYLEQFKLTKLAKDEEGKFLSPVEYNEEENYTCDYCNKPFKAKFYVDLITEPIETEIEKHITKLHKPALFLDEE